MACSVHLSLQVLPTQLIPDEKEGKVLRVRFIQKEGIKMFDPTYLFDEVRPKLSTTFEISTKTRMAVN